MPHPGVHNLNGGSPGSGCYAPARLSAPFPDGAWCPPRMSSMLDDHRIYQTFVAILLPPLVLLG